MTEINTIATTEDIAEDDRALDPHAFHRNLPAHHKDLNGDMPYVTTFAEKKARQVLETAFSIELAENLFVGNDREDKDAAIRDDDDDEEEELEVPAGSGAGAEKLGRPETLLAFTRRCARLQAQLSSLEGYKHSGISQLQMAELVLHLLRLLSCTITYYYDDKDNDNDVGGSTGDNGKKDSTEKPRSRRRRARLHYDAVGYIYQGPKDFNKTVEDSDGKSASQLEEELDRPFALPAPARELLLSVVVSVLSNKGPLRSISNSSIYPEGMDSEERFLMILHWKAFLRMLLRTAPYLDEHKVGSSPVDSNSRQSNIIKRTVQLIRDARHFFDQGVLPPSTSEQQPAAVADKTAHEVWAVVQNDVLYHSHTHACYRASILLYLFQPTRCSPEFYLQVLPQWFQSWTNIDRCPEYDFLWLALFCRARKHVSPDRYDWGPIRRRLLTNAQYWLQLPIGGAALDKSFPRVANPRSRSCPPRLKVFAAGAASSYEEGIDFVAKVAKLLVTSLGNSGGRDEPMTEADENQSSLALEAGVSEGTADMLRFLNFCTPYFHPSNLGSWTFTLGAFLHYFCYELSCRVGAHAGFKSLVQAPLGSALAQALDESQPGWTDRPIPSNELVLLMNALLPLCQLAIYSKNGHVGRAGEAAMLYLVQLDPVHAAPSFMDFATRALDITAVNLSHQAPAALSALTRLIQPSLRSQPSILLQRLPEMLRLSLAGIDSNDQNKTIRTLILYRSLTSWLPVGGNPETWDLLQCNPDASKIGESDGGSVVRPNDGTMRIGTSLLDSLTEACRTCPEYLQAVGQLPETSILKQGVEGNAEDSPEMQRLLLEEAMSAMSDWALEFLDRVFGLLRATGEREKAGKTSSGVANRHSSADVHQARNTSRVLKECLSQVFCAMDDEAHALSVRSVARFLEEETYPNAAKDASLLCQCVSAARKRGPVASNDSCPPMDEGGEVTPYTSPGLDALIPVLTDDLPHHSVKTVVYRLRCLAGAVRYAGSHGLMKHRSSISSAIDFALASDDRHLFKTGCKLLRHTLFSLSESYPISSCNRPAVFANPSSPIKITLGRSAQLHGDPVLWHVPDGSCVDFAWELLKVHVSQRLDSLTADTKIDGKSSENGGSRSRMLNAVEVQELRRCLRVIRYCIRGGASLLLDCDSSGESNEENYVPYEQGCHSLIESASAETREALLAIRGRLCSFLVVLASVIGSETLYPDAILDIPDDDPYRKTLPLISSDPKICKETCDIALLLLTRRGAAFRSQEARTIWKAQKQLATDFPLCAQVDYMVESLQNAALYGDPKTIRYKDGEDGGKTVPRRLLVARVKLFHDALQRSASLEVPKRLRRADKQGSASQRRILFSAKSNLQGMIGNLEEVLTYSARPLDAYEGIVDGLYALCCHSNTQVRGSAISVIDYAMTRFGWLVGPRVPRLLSAMSLKDEGMNGKFGIPSCTMLVDKVNQQGKRKQLAEAIKGVCSILALPRTVKQCLASEKMRVRFAETICGTDHLTSLVPTEETQKTVHYFQSVFSPFRSKIFFQPRISTVDHESHEANLKFALDVLSEDGDSGIEADSSDSNEGKAAHWRKLLLAGWFLLTLIDDRDLKEAEGDLATRTWFTCFRILENESGQPLQRVALGLLGKLLSLTGPDGNLSFLKERMAKESFCKVLGQALVYDHKEDSSVGGGHDAQWAAGVEDIVRDASRNVAPRCLFPFQRTSQSLGSFKVSHAQLVELILSRIEATEAKITAQFLLTFSREMAAAPPSEDQRNQQITSAEIFAGVCGAYLRGTDQVSPDGWTEVFLPFIEEAMGKIPFSLSGAYFDAIRYALQFCPPRSFYPLTSWLVEKIRSTLWQPTASDGDVEMSDAQTNTNGSSHGSSQGTEGFTAQSKWLYLFSAVLIEMDEMEVDGMMSRRGWYSRLVNCAVGETELDPPKSTVVELEQSWQLVTTGLLPRLTEALGHPFDSCRDHISRCLFRICYCHRKRERISASRAPSRCNSLQQLAGAENGQKDPGHIVVSKLATLEKANDWPFNDRYNALSTARRFISYCVHLGEAKFEYSDYVIPLLPLAFEALKSTVEEEIKENGQGTQDDNAAKRALEAEVIKGYRFMIAEVSITAVISYGQSGDITRVLDVVANACKHDKWQVRHASANFLRCFQGAHKFLFEAEHGEMAMAIVTDLLADERREVSSAAMAALTGMLAVSSVEEIARMVQKYATTAGRTKMKRPKKGAPQKPSSAEMTEVLQAKESKRARNQQISVFFLCAAVMAQPYDTPPYVPVALAAISKHSFERNAPLGVRDTVKKCCAEYKRTHMSDNWEMHRSVFSQEQLEALDDVVSTPHYYA